LQTERILVTGGKGIVGSKLVEELRKRGHDVSFCDVSHYHDPQYFRCDVSKFRQIERILDENSFDYVYHLAAEFGRWNGEDFYENLWMTNAVGTKNLIRLQERDHFRMIFSSSSEIYGDYPDVMVEDVPDRIAIRQLNDYAMSKWVNEMQIMNSADLHETETVRVRLFNTYGPGEYYSPYRSVICKFIYHALHDQPYVVYTGHKRTSSFIDDTIRTLANIVNNFHTGEVYNIAGEERHDIKTASDIILGYLDKNDDMVKYDDIEPATTVSKIVDISKSKRDLDHRSTVPLSEGIRRTIEWQRRVYNV